MWQRLRKFWWTRICGFPPEAAADLMDGIDAGDRPVLGIRLYLALRPRRRKLPTPEDLARLDADFQAGGPVRDKVVRKVLDDLGHDAALRREARGLVARYLAGRN